MRRRRNITVGKLREYDISYSTYPWFNVQFINPLKKYMYLWRGVLGKELSVGILFLSKDS